MSISTYSEAMLISGASKQISSDRGILAMSSKLTEEFTEIRHFYPAKIRLVYPKLTARTGFVKFYDLSLRPQRRQ